jgi:hypothetical protein
MSPWIACLHGFRIGLPGRLPAWGHASGQQERAQGYCAADDTEGYWPERADKEPRDEHRHAHRPDIHRAGRSEYARADRIGSMSLSDQRARE